MAHNTEKLREPVKRLTSAQRAEKVISEWRAAYLVVNDRPAPRVLYEKGWCVLRDPFTTRVRLAQVERWTEALNRRALISQAEGEAQHDPRA